MAETCNYQVKFVRFTKLGFLQELEEWNPFSPHPPNSKGKQSAILSSGDLFLSLDLALPPAGLNARDLEKLRDRNIKTYFIVYDVLPITHPNLFPSMKKQIFETWFATTSASSGVFYISHSTKTEAVTVYRKMGLPTPLSARVIPLGPLASHVSEETKEIEVVSPVANNFLAVGTVEPRKDYGGILDAFEYLWATGFDARLVIVGKPGWKSSTLQRRLESHSEWGKRLFWHQDATDEELLAIMNSSVALIANSVGEGFGLPLLEASATGLAVIARDIPVFREVAPSAKFFDDGDPRSMARTIQQFLSEKRPESIGEKQAQQSWQSAAKIMTDTLGLC